MFPDAMVSVAEPAGHEDSGAPLLLAFTTEGENAHAHINATRMITFIDSSKSKDHAARCRHRGLSSLRARAAIAPSRMTGTRPTSSDSEF